MGAGSMTFDKIEITKPVDESLYKPSDWVKLFIIKNVLISAGNFFDINWLCFKKFILKWRKKFFLLQNTN